MNQNYINVLDSCIVELSNLSNVVSLGLKSAVEHLWLRGYAVPVFQTIQRRYSAEALTENAQQFFYVGYFNRYIGPVEPIKAYCYSFV